MYVPHPQLLSAQVHPALPRRPTDIRRQITMAPPNITGFDPKKFAAAAGTPANDPWKRR